MHFGSIFIESRVYSPAMNHDIIAETMSAISASDYPAYAANISNKKQAPLGWGQRPVLLILDVSKAYFSESSPTNLLSSTCGTGASVPTNVSRLVDAARAGGCPVVWARTVFTNCKLRDAGIWTQKVPEQLLEVFSNKNENGLHEFLEKMTPCAESGGDSKSTVADLVIDKKFVSAFFGTNLAGQLAMISADTVVLCGAKTGGEIRQSILDAQGLGFRGIVSYWLYQFYQILRLTQIIITGCS
jgi:maleamate amidohydrolase